MIIALTLLLTTVIIIAHTGIDMNGGLMSSLVTGAVSIASGIVGYAAPKPQNKLDSVTKKDGDVMITSTSSTPPKEG